jgi:S1-C subfamily serine protease
MFKQNTHEKRLYNNRLNLLQKKTLLNQITNKQIPIKQPIKNNDTDSLISDIIKTLEKHDIQIKYNTLSADGSKLIVDGLAHYTNSNFLRIGENEKQIQENKTEIARIETLTTDNEKQIQENNTEIARIETLTTDNEKQIQENKAEIARIETSTTDNEKQIQENKAEIARIETLITDNERQIQENNMEIYRMNTLTTNNKKQIQENKTEIARIETLTTENTSKINYILNNLKNETELNDFSDLQKSVSQIVFVINNNIYRGSGWFYAENNDDLSKGYYITAAHCVMEITDGVYYKASNIYIQNPITNKWTSINVNKVYVDGIADVALIESGIDFTNHPEYCLKLADKMPESGAKCIVIGNPGGIDEDSISIGYIRDPHYTEPGGYQITDSIHVNTPGIGGSSGGPIVDIHKRVIGLYTFGLGGLETFGGGSNRDTLFNTLSVLKTNQNNKKKLYLGLDWFIPNPFTLRTFYNNASTFDSNGVYIQTVSTGSPFLNVLSAGDLLLECVIIGTNDIIKFGCIDTQRTPGLLIYYPLNTVINIKYIKRNTSTVHNANITLNKNYSNVSDLLDGPLQTGKSEELQQTRKIFNPHKLIDAFQVE